MNRKISIVVSIIVLMALVVGTIVFTVTKIKKYTPEETLNEYVSFLQNADYSSMYNLISESSKERISEEDFISRNKNIYEGISMSDYKLEIKSKEKQENKSYKIDYDVSMNTVAGELKFYSNVKIVKNK